MNKVRVHRGRTNVVQANLGIDITGDTLTSEIRSKPEQDATLLATWTLSVVNAATGQILLTLDNSVTADIEVNSGFMDIKRISGGEPLPVFDEPLEVLFVGSVTA